MVSKNICLSSNYFFSINKLTVLIGCHQVYFWNRQFKSLLGEKDILTAWIFFLFLRAAYLSHQSRGTVTEIKCFFMYTHFFVTHVQIFVGRDKASLNWYKRHTILNLVFWGIPFDIEKWYKTFLLKKNSYGSHHCWLS